ncbi:radical SAM/SPASM domain-containing protein [Heliophilum fasciatum]|uniref:radical SAM/SPASM domain-containing protein n=1 Tax=Heliophilum fasciatum TaxID=35700 RepID=UPI0014050F8A|nr:radical SAM protein [Heliophilum fasciatum]MCW2277088.1 uncharacterized protein [Heliophilum fasciatum]
MAETFVMTEPCPSAEVAAKAHRADEVSGVAEPAGVSVRLPMAAMELNLTFNCNLACDYCFVHNKDPQERMSLATATQAIVLLMDHAAYPQVTITLIGGEPLLAFPLIKQIIPYAEEAARARHIQINWGITTNGTLLTEEILQYFADHRMNMMLSIDGGPETHDRYRRTKSGAGTWHRLAALIPLIQQYRSWVVARMTVSPAAIEQMVDDFRQIVDLGINQVIIAPAQGAALWSLKEIEVYGRNLLAIMEEYHRLKQLGYPIYIDDFEKESGPDERWGCHAGIASLAVAPNGDLYPCSKLLGLADETKRWKVGNVHTSIDYGRLEPLQDTAQSMPAHCRRCTRKCYGGCYAVNAEQTGNHFLPSEETCLFWVVTREVQRQSSTMRYSCSSCGNCPAM